MKPPVIEIFQAPSVEPVSLDEAKTYLRIDGENEDDLINSMISAARITTEKYIGLSIISQKIKLSYDECVPTEIILPYGPVTAIDSVTIIDTDENDNLLDNSNYYLSAGKVSLIFNQQPYGRRTEIIYSTGLATDESDVPAILKQGLFAHIAGLYERKDASAAMSSASISLYNFYRNVRI